MKIKAIGSRAGPKVAYTSGKEYDVPDERARRMIARGHAVAVGKHPVSRPAAAEVETAEETQVLETTTRYRRKK